MLFKRFMLHLCITIYIVTIIIKSDEFFEYDTFFNLYTLTLELPLIPKNTKWNMIQAFAHLFYKLS